jgi:hypothetical protein
VCEKEDSCGACRVVLNMLSCLTEVRPAKGREHAEDQRDWSLTEQASPFNVALFLKHTDYFERVGTHGVRVRAQCAFQFEEMGTDGFVELSSK